MKRTLLLILTLGIGLSSPLTSCSETSAQVNDASNSWFNRKTLIATGALATSAALSLALYKALSTSFYKLNQSFTQWVINQLSQRFPNLLASKEEMEGINLQERTSKEAQQMNNIESILKSRNWSKKAIKELRQNQVYQQKQFKEDLDDILINHYYNQIYTVLKTVPSQKRLEWADDYKDILLTSKGSEEGLSGTKYQALEKLKKNTDNFISIPYHKPYQSNIPLQLSQ